MEPRTFRVDPKRLKLLLVAPLVAAGVAFAVGFFRIATRSDGHPEGILIGATLAALVIVPVGLVVVRLQRSREIVLGDGAIRSRGGGVREVFLRRDEVEAIVHLPKGKVLVRGKRGKGSILLPALLADRDVLLAELRTWAPEKHGFFEPDSLPVALAGAGVIVPMVLHREGASPPVVALAALALLGAAAIAWARR